MGKALKTVGVIIGGAALIATGVGALAMPAMAGSTTLFGVSVGTLNTISSGLVAVGGLLDKPKSQGSAQPDEWTSNPDQPTPFLMGRMGIAGKIVQRDEFGPDNMYQGIVGILSGAGPIRGVTGFAGDKQPVTFGANGIAVTSQWQGEMWMVRRSGAQPDTALTVPAGLKSGGSAFEWLPAAKLSGKACYLQVLGENSKGTAFPAGVPDPVHTAEGIYGYDPRYDDTYPGGAGPCRLGVRSTYRWIEDGGIGGLNWALGLVENGQVVGGIGASLDGIDVPAFVEVANIADANNWKLAAWPDTSEDVSAVLDQLLQAAGAVRARHAGKISCVSRGAPRASVATITARDTAGDIELDTAPSLFNRLNTITPRFMSEAAGWVLTPANAVSFAQYVTDDGGKHSDQIDYRFVSSLKQAAELAAYDILDAREPFSGTIPLKAHMRHLKRGDTFLVSEPGFLMDGVKCIVLSRSYDPKTAQVRIGFRSETDSKHALALGKTTTLPDFPSLTPTDPTLVSPPLPIDWVIAPTPGTGTGQLPSFDLSGVVSNQTATSILVEVYEVPAGQDPNTTPPVDTGWKQVGVYAPTATSIPITVQPDRYYWVGIKNIRGSNFSARQVWGPYLAGQLLAEIDPASPALEDIRADIQAAFGDVFDIDGLLTQARTDINTQGTEIAAARGGQGNLSARLSQLNQFRIDGDTALGTSITNLTARTANTEADIIDIENAAANDRTATAQAIQQVSAGLNTVGQRPNRLANSDFSDGFTRWRGADGWASYVHGQFGPLAYSNASGHRYLISEALPLGPSATFSVSIVGDPGSNPGGGGFYLQYLRADFSVISDGNAFRNYGEMSWTNRIATTFTTTADTAYVIVVFWKGETQDIVHLSRVMVAFGTEIVPWNDSATTKSLSASVTEQSLAIIDLENQNALASWSIKAAATGGKPTILQLLSGSFGSSIAMTAEQIYFGDNTVFDDASDTIQTVWGSTRKVMAWGAPFGPDQLVEWTGPSNIALSSMTKGNAGFWVDRFGAYGPTPLPSFWARVTPTAITRSRTGAGPISTALNDVMVTCYTGTSGATCTWSRVSGDATIGYPSTGFQPVFNANLAAGQTKTALFVGLVAKNGDVDLVYVTVEFSDNV